MFGIIRKIDDLGRIVIPIEIRKVLNIKKEDDLEIKIIDKKIIIEKYSKLENILDKILKYCYFLEKKIEFPFLLTNSDKVLYDSKKIIKDALISSEYYKVLKERKTKKGKGTFKITNNYSVNSNYYFLPLIVNTDLLGSILFVSDKEISKEIITLIETIIDLIKIM